MSGEQRVVIVGAGLAGVHAAKALRKEGFDGSIVLIGSDAELPYDRTKLSKEYLQGHLDRAKLFVKSREWFDENRIELRVGESVDRIDRDAKTVHVASGDEFAYDWLVLAMGSSSRRIPLPGADLPGVLSLRSLADSDGMREAFAEDGRLAIVGAGWIGLEIAASAKQVGLDVTVAAPVPQPLGNILGDTIGAYFADLHRRNGVDLRMNTAVTGVIERDGRAAGIETDSGPVEADHVLIAVGAVPNSGLAEAAGLELERGGVVVDERMRTSDPAILAIGDIADAQNTLLGIRLRREHWDNALRMGKLAAKTIVGAPGEYDWLPYFYTDQFDLSMEYVGNNAADDEPVIRGSQESGEFIVFWRREGVVTAAMNVNVPGVSDTLRRIVGREADATRLADASVELADLAR